MFDAAKKLDTNLADVPDQSQRSFGRFGGSTIASGAVNMDGAGLKLRATWLRADMCYLLVRAATQDASHAAFTSH